MKICWDNLERYGIYLTKNGIFRDSKKRRFIYNDSCKKCGEPFLSRNKQNLFCDSSCSKIGKNNPFYNKHHSIQTKKKLSSRIVTEETRRKMSKSGKGKIINEYVRKKISNSMKIERLKKDSIFNTKEYREKLSKNNCMKKKEVVKKVFLTRKNNGKPWHSKETIEKISKANNKHYFENNIPLYDIYAHQIEWCEKVRRNKYDKNILEVKCTWCGKWYIPDIISVRHRAQTLKGNYKGENRLYCSKSCKKCCPIYGKKPETLMKEDAVMAGNDSWQEMNREVQPELRQMVFKRDEYQCIKCGSTEDLHCHHIEGTLWNPIESADMDICITVCKECHKKIHQEKGCSYHDMKCNG